MTSSKSSTISPCAVVPVYNHPDTLPATIAALQAHALHIIVVDDGSDVQCQELIERLQVAYQNLTIVTRSSNGGKGAAVKDGLRTALSKGFTHAVQVDADGQHSITDIPRFLGEAAKSADNLIVGYPAYDSSVPKLRYYGRYATHMWVWINSLSLTIKDSMCGFRVYPLERTCKLLDMVSMGDRMDFDTEFIVRWHWEGLPLTQLETRVIYPENGISHFRLLTDNKLITIMHTRLFFGMLLRLPMLIKRKLTRS